VGGARRAEVSTGTKKRRLTLKMASSLQLRLRGGEKKKKTPDVDLVGQKFYTKTFHREAPKSGSSFLSLFLLLKRHLKNAYVMSGNELRRKDSCGSLLRGKGGGACWLSSIMSVGKA